MAQEKYPSNVHSQHTILKIPIAYIFIKKTTTKKQKKTKKNTQQTNKKRNKTHKHAIPLLINHINVGRIESLPSGKCSGKTREIADSQNSKQHDCLQTTAYSTEKSTRPTTNTYYKGTSMHSRHGKQTTKWYSIQTNAKYYTLP